MHLCALGTHKRPSRGRPETPRMMHRLHVNQRPPPHDGRRHKLQPITQGPTDFGPPAYAHVPLRRLPPWSKERATWALDMRPVDTGTSMETTHTLARVPSANRDSSFSLGRPPKWGQKVPPLAVLADEALLKTCDGADTSEEGANMAQKPPCVACVARTCGSTPQLLCRPW